MQTEAVFENIASRIIDEIKQAEKTIFIAVAWFTNQNIFEEIMHKAIEGCEVQIILSNDEINNNSAIDFSHLEAFNGKIYKIGNSDKELMHNKFCVIDYTTVITGSYNWSYKAENNFENIIVNYNDTALANQFIKEFNQIKKLYYPNETIEQKIDFPLDKIIKRLEIVKNLVILEDIDEINSSVSKLDIYSFNEDINLIIEALKNKEFSLAITKIQNFISANLQLTLWNDPEIAGLQLEIKILESQVNAFDNERIELEKVLSDFQHRHTTELGNIILEILKLRKEKFKNNKEKAQETENDFNEYSKDFEIEKDKHKFELNEEEKAELKKKFRKASTLCHPDKVIDELKAEAQELFIALKVAYDANDLQKVNEILEALEQKKHFKSNSDTISEKSKLKEAIQQLKSKLEKVTQDINQIKQSEVFNTISKIIDWDVYFQETKIQLEQELETLSIQTTYE